MWRYLMKIKKGSKLFGFILLGLLLMAQVSKAQEGSEAYTAVATLDTTNIQIGEQLILRLSVAVKPTDLVNFPEDPLAFLPLELVKSFETDSIDYSGKLNLTKKYALTQFDAGNYTIPKQKISINNQLFLTDSSSVSVRDVEVDTLKQKLYHIKPITQVEKIATYDWLWQLLFILGALAAILVAILRAQKKRKLAADNKKLPPYDRALLALDNLEKSQYLLKEEYKEYYSELTNIVRQYLEEEVHIAALESTTDQLIEKLELLTASGTLSLEEDILIQFKQILQTADLVKFAKSTPKEGVAEKDRSRLKEIVVKTKESIAPPTEEELAAIAATEAAQKAREIQRARKKKLIVASLVFIGVLLGIIGYVGPKNIWDTALRNPNKILLEKDWIESEYGTPAVIIQTPEVLIRDTTAVVQLGEVSLQKFKYTHPKGVLFISLETKKFVQQEPPNFEQLTENGLRALEALGAKNIITKQENFEAQEGVRGMKTFGTADFFIDGDTKATKEDYILLFFGGKGYVQSIGMRWIDGDPYAEEISEKIMGSIAFEKITETPEK